MPTQYIARRATVSPNATAKAGAAPIYVDSDDNILKFIPAGSGTTEVQILDASSSQTLTNKILTSPTITTGITPTTNDGAALGTGTLMFSDLFLASGGVLNFNNGDITVTHAANTLAFAGATAAGVNGYSFDMAAGTIATEAHGVDVAATGTLASGKSLVGLNVVATAAGTAGAWLAGLYVKGTQPSKMVNGYICAAEFELADTSASPADNSVLVLNSTRAHTGSPAAAYPLIMAREYGSTPANVFLRVFGDSGQGALNATDATTLVTQAPNAYEANADCAIRCMVGSTPIWLIATTTAPS